MKHSLIFLMAFSQLIVTAQKKEQYYDFFWKPSEPGLARYYSTTEKTDSGWLRHDYYISDMTLQMRALYEDADCKVQNGYCVYYHSNGNISTAGRRVHGKREGVCVQYHFNGMMADSATYSNDKPLGSRFRWHRNGYLADSIAHVNDSTDIHFGWFDNGAPESGGYMLDGKFQGKWKFYHRNGALAGEEVYDKGRVISKQYFNEDGSAQPDTAKANTETAFKNGGGDGWRRFLQKNTQWPAGYELANTNLVTVGVSFCVDEEGKLTDIEMWVPFHPVFDKEAIDIIRKSPAWKPAILHNRKMKSWFRQPITFQQE
ncbi:MAG: energy transducer TonB [Bacteroidota bacterium]